ncbi:hypothetical protein PGT21_021305 [Puccinia graminis f. sp. tritici]|uniref:Uncharacterized protein n=1 Tax=Puccinia graminis f. sp. tritici TaxID=56615 RepID=A0A5B0NEC7_PUCGR|nr:hypothetical protein PGT21_021305 [Puccinia graminis f. sp. tritici]
MSPSDCVRRRPKKVLSHRTLEYWIITPGSDGKNNGGNRAQIGWNQRCSLSQCGIWIGGFCQMAEPRRLGWVERSQESGMLASGVCRMVPSQWRTCEFSDTLWLGPSLFITHSVVLKIEWLGRSRSDTASSRPVGSSGGPEPEFAGHRHGGDSETYYQKSQAALARQRVRTSTAKIHTLTQYDRVKRGSMSFGIRLPGTAAARDGPNYLEYTALIWTHRAELKRGGLQWPIGYDQAGREYVPFPIRLICARTKFHPAGGFGSWTARIRTPSMKWPSRWRLEMANRL